MQSTRDYNDATAERSAKSRLKLLLPVLHIIGRRSSSSSSSCCSFGNKRRIHCISYLLLLLLLLLTELPGWPPPLTVICWPNSFRIAVDNLICIVPIYARLMDNSDTKPGQSWVKQLQHAPAAVAASSFLSYQLICIYTRVYFCTICVRRSLSASV